MTLEEALKEANVVYQIDTIEKTTIRSTVTVTEDTISLGIEELDTTTGSWRTGGYWQGHHYGDQERKMAVLWDLLDDADDIGYQYPLDPNRNWQTTFPLEG